MSPRIGLSLPFPGSVIASGSTDPTSVRAIQRRLNQLGCGPVAEDGEFGVETSDAVDLFQARNFDKLGVSVKADSQVGPMTWGALFGEDTLPVASTAASPLIAGALSIAAGEIGTLENPIGSNRGPRVDQYLRSVGLNPENGSFPWCAAFLYFCFQEAAKAIPTRNPVVKTAGVLEHWNLAGQAGIHRIGAADAAVRPSLVRPGMVFIITTGNVNGHTGLIEKVDGVQLTTVEGNTNDTGSREGIGVFRHKMRRVSQINKGFIDYR